MDAAGGWFAKAPGAVCLFFCGPSEESEKVGYNGLDVTMDNQQEEHLTVPVKLSHWMTSLETIRWKFRYFKPFQFNMDKGLTINISYLSLSKLIDSPN